jgi:hypothetical protein
MENISWRLWYREMAISSSAARPGENNGWKEEAHLDEKMGDDVLSSTRDETLPALPPTPLIPGKSPPFSSFYIRPCSTISQIFNQSPFDHPSHLTLFLLTLPFFSYHFLVER